MIRARTYGKLPTTRIAMFAAAFLIAVAAAAVWLASADRTGDRTEGRAADDNAAKGAAELDSVNDDPGTPPSRWTPPVTDDPAVLARWLADLIYGMDHRQNRETYVNAVTATTLDALAEDQDAARDLIGEDPARDAAAQLVPEDALWERLAEHGQWSSFDIREPVGTEAIDTGDELAAAGVAVTKVLVVGTQTIHYTDENSGTQTHVGQPALGVLIACGPGLDGCRLVRVVEH